MFIFSYTRADALRDGIQIDLSSDATALGFDVPVFITTAAFEKIIADGGTWRTSPTNPEEEELTFPDGSTAPQRTSRLVRHAFRELALRPETRVSFLVEVSSGNAVEVFAERCARDIDDPTPAIVLMLQEDI